jgi:hypothetical protein
VHVARAHNSVELIGSAQRSKPEVDEIDDDIFLDLSRAKCNLNGNNIMN